jgi:hypothetical protein
VDHYIATEEAHDAHANDPASPGGKWYLLNPIMTSYIIHMEPPDSCLFDETWTCNLCAAHYRTPVTRSEVVAHVKAECVSFLLIPVLHLLICPLQGMISTYPSKAKISFIRSMDHGQGVPLRYSILVSSTCVAIASGHLIGNCAI